MLSELVWEVVVGVLTIFLADRFVSGASFNGSLSQLLFCGFVLGLLYGFIRPSIKKLTLPFIVLTLGFLGFIIDIATIWLVDIAFVELEIIGIVPLILTAIISSLLHTLLALKK